MHTAFTQIQQNSEKSSTPVGETVFTTPYLDETLCNANKMGP